MLDCFEDVKRELVNGNQLARSYDEFITTVLKAIQVALNSDAGQEFLHPAVNHAIETNMSPEEWSHCKANIMIALFYLVLDECPQLKHEMARHLYHELRKEVKA